MNAIFSNINTLATTEPNKLALTFIGPDGSVQESLTYSQLKAATLRLAQGLKCELNVAPGDRVALVFRPSLEFIKVFLACWANEAITVPIKYPSNEEEILRTQRIIEDCTPKCVVGSSGPYHELNTTRIADDPTLAFPLVKETSTALIQYTSGSTGHPKGVVISHQNIRSNHDLISGILRRSTSIPVETIVSWLPHFHDMGLIGNYLLGLRFGWTGHYMAPETFLTNPES